MTFLKSGSAAFLAMAALGLLVCPLAAQQRRVEQLYTADGIRLDFPPEGVWRAKARLVAEQRARLLSAGRFGQLNAPQAAVTGGVLQGTMSIPTFLVGFNNTDTTALPKRAQYDSIFYTSTPLFGRAYTVRAFYDEMSNGVFHVQGQTYDWVKGDSGSTYYLNPPNCSTDPLSCLQGRQRLRELFVKALTQYDAAVDFGQFDNDGPDGVPNSGDDDGIVDLVQFVQPVRGAECSGPGYNAHHYVLAGLGGQYTTGDARSGGGSIKVDTYQLVAGVGGTGCSSDTQIMAIGTSAHELGHGLGLPDLYDVNLTTEGVGEWALMGSGNYTSLNSPAHFDAWSLQQMGWVTLVPLTTSGTYRVGAVEISDSVFVVRPLAANPRGEYFLLENKQAQKADTANMNTGGATGPKVGGLLVWHVDSTKIAQNMASNTVNAGPIHGVALVQADGQRQLDNGGNRGDAGDPYPGSSVNRRFSFDTNPKAVMNNDTTVFTGFLLDSVTQVTPQGQMVFKVSVGGVTIVRATDTTAQVSVDGTRYRRFAQILAPGTVHTVDMDSAQVTADSLRQFVFQSWSNGKQRSDTITAKLEGDSITATVSQLFRLRARLSGTGTGTVTATPSIDSLRLAQGRYVQKDSVVKLKASATGGNLFDGWAGDTTTIVDSLVLTMAKAYTLLAKFATPLVAGAVSPPQGITGQSYSYSLTASGGTGTYAWAVIGGSLPAGLTLTSAGKISGAPTQAGSFSATARVSSGSQTADVAVVITVVPALVAGAGTPPAGVVGQAYSHSLTATGGTGTYSWQVASGSLPPGLSLSTAGAVTGTPTTAGDYAASAQVTSGSQAAAVSFNLLVVGQLTVVVGLPDAPVMGKSFSHTLTASGGTGATTWAVASGALPDGLTLSTAGLISGIPSKTGSFSANVRATSGSQTADGTVSLTVTAPALVAADVVSQILGTRQPLSADDLKYLDLLGNHSGGFDVGDFLAWVNATGAQAPEIAAALAHLAPAMPPISAPAKGREKR